ncbi:hypothetical protein BX286_0008 [Streptomyces sp. 3211.6]|uniref:hypothetical protein n=1 Tax=Streptomyces sp. 3211.6 TaxID=1938845 RepID=UPI000EAC7EA1|nr:hypothetical protein [Streptomyces sp. 3211.6]RKT02146.1 hypothetical protein BX286_0008 [Streptomyces sp. 3211.6]
MTENLTRRRLLGTAAAAAVGGALLTVEAGSAFAATWSRRSLLPTIGQTVNQSINAFGATLTTGSEPPATVNFIGMIVVKVLTGGADYVRLQVLDFQVEGAHPRYGKITLRLPDADVSPASTLRLGPGGLLATYRLPFDATLEREGHTTGPFTYTTLNPGTWQGTTVTWPPPPQDTNADGSPTGGHLYAGHAPLPLGTIAHDGTRTPLAQLKMNMNMGALLT